jgi:hypothetical protein
MHCHFTLKTLPEQQIAMREVRQKGNKPRKKEYKNKQHTKESLVVGPKRTLVFDNSTLHRRVALKVPTVVDRKEQDHSIRIL